MYECLLSFGVTFGHCDVPYCWEEDAALGRWLQRQRGAREKNELTEDQVARLDELNIEWDAANVRWKRMLSELRHFHEINGHCRCPADSENWPKLANWIATQRKLYRRQKLSAAQIAALEAIGFPWGSKKQERHANVSQTGR
jgi:hypothetical protein